MSAYRLFVAIVDRLDQHPHPYAYIRLVDTQQIRTCFTLMVRSFYANIRVAESVRLVCGAAAGLMRPKNNPRPTNTQCIEPASLERALLKEDEIRPEAAS